VEETIYKLPSEFLARIKHIYPSSYQKICTTFLKRKISTFRINPIKTDLIALRKELVKARVRFKELSFPKGAFILKSPLRHLQQTRLYKDGLIYVQNISSMIPPLVLDAHDSDTICDLCAAPGAKTTQIASSAPGSKIIAFEKNRIRFYKLQANLRIQGTTNVEVLLSDGIWVRKKYPEYFDRILLDVPCSVEGRFLVSNPHSFKYWKMRKIKEMMHTQKKLLYAAYFALKEGGILTYSTCTFAPEENEGMINWFLEKFGEKMQMLPVNIPLQNAKPGLSGWHAKRFSSQVSLSRRIIPNDYMEGFYIAKLKKVSA